MGIFCRERLCIDRLSLEHWAVQYIVGRRLFGTEVHYSMRQMVHDMIERIFPAVACFCVMALLPWGPQCSAVAGQAIRRGKVEGVLCVIASVAFLSWCMLGVTVLDWWMTRSILQCSSAYDMIWYGAILHAKLWVIYSTAVACSIILAQQLISTKVEGFEPERLFGDDGIGELDMSCAGMREQTLTSLCIIVTSLVKSDTYRNRIELVYISSWWSLFALQLQPRLTD